MPICRSAGARRRECHRAKNRLSIARTVLLDSPCCRATCRIAALWHATPTASSNRSLNGAVPGQRHFLHLHAAVRALHPVHFDVHRRLEYSPRQVAHCPLSCVVGFSELAPAPGTFQLAVATLPPHPQPQLRSPLIDLVAIDPIAGPSQDIG